MTGKDTEKTRLDMLLVARGHAATREQAKRMILAGNVEVEGIALPKAGMMVRSDIAVTVKQRERFVSRGGLKLQAALDHFGIAISDLVCTDIGASTGGFTDCMLQNGARLVFAVDVGATQMHERIRYDDRVKLVEHTNARNLDATIFSQQPEFAAVDVSFISILHITSVLPRVLAPAASAVFLIKPQFEAGREAVSRGRGVIRDEKVHRQVLETVLDELPRQSWQVCGLMPSPIAGGSGNVEFLCHASVAQLANPVKPVHIDIDAVIHSARAGL
jgi:23S rRNA (cytidine1920-2'-O)/16S rRNA (cytidine1409-2'-O)-methyltransferase